MNDNAQEKIRDWKNKSNAYLCFQKMEYAKKYKNNTNFKKKLFYYITNKKWFNKFKLILNFDEYFNKDKESKNYIAMQRSLNSINLDDLGKENIDLVNNINNIEYIKEEKYFEQFNIKVPKNIELIKDDFYIKILKRKPGFIRCGIYLGYNTLLMTIGEDDKNIFCCELIEPEINDIINFDLKTKIKGIIQMKQDNKGSQYIADRISKKNGIINYLESKHIDLNKKEKQDIKDAKNNIIATYINYCDDEDNNNLINKEKIINKENKKDMKENNFKIENISNKENKENKEKEKEKDNNNNIEKKKNEIISQKQNIINEKKIDNKVKF